jgi:hypothetical protein
VVRIEEAKRVVDYIGDISLADPHESEDKEYFDIRQSQLEEKRPLTVIKR